MTGRMLMKTICTSITPSEFHYDFPQKKEELLFFDIETTGLSPKTSSIYLIGVLFYDPEEGCFKELQWFAERNKDEKEVLVSFLEFLEHYAYLYHFNGRTFDIPYVLEKCSRHAISLSRHVKEILLDDTGMLSIDILLHVKKLKRFLSLGKCSQKALEQFLGIFRKDTFSGGDLIPVYAEYTRMRLLEPENAGALEQTLLLHNFEDVEMMLSVCSLLQYETLFCENAPFFEEASLQNMKITLSQEAFFPDGTTEEKNQQEDTKKEENTEWLLLSVPSSVTFPKEIKKTCSYPQNKKKPDAAKEVSSQTGQLPDAILSIKEGKLCFSFPVFKGTLKYFLEDYKNYYYLPAEDLAVHKSIASFADSTHRKKATRATCYTKKSGSFLPSLMPMKQKTAKNATLFLKEYGDKTAYYELPKNYETDTAFWKKFLTEQISCFR